MAFCAFAPSSASLATSLAMAVRSLPSGSERCASVSTVARRALSPRAAHQSRKNPSIPGCAGSSLRSRSNQGSAASGRLRMRQCTIAICRTAPNSSSLLRSTPLDSCPS